MLCGKKDGGGPVAIGYWRANVFGFEGGRFGIRRGNLTRPGIEMLSRTIFPG